MKKFKERDYIKLMRRNMECFECGRELKKVSKRKFKKWESGELFFICKECRKEE